MQQPPIYQVDYYSQFHDCILGIGKRFEDRPAVTTYTRGGIPVTRTFRQLCDDSCAFGEGLLLEGYQGAHIALAGENCQDWLTAFYGVTASGNVAVLIDVEQTGDGMLAMFKRADVEAVIASDVIAQVLSEARLPQHIKLIVWGGKEMPAYGQDFSALLEKGRASIAGGSRLFLNQQVNPQATALIAYTSGTTSISKPVMLSQQGVCLNASESVAMIQATEKVYSSLPLYHTYGLTCSVLGPLNMGGHMGLNGDLKTMARDMALFNAQTIMTVPLISQILHKKLMATAAAMGVCSQACAPGMLQRAKKALFGEGEFTPPAPTPEQLACRDKALGALRVVVTGGAHLAEEIWRDFQAFGVDVQQGYGITECAPLISATRSGIYNPPGSAGWKLPSYEMRFEDGEILVKGPSVMQGYYKAPELTQEAFLDGWFCTGDVGFIDKAGLIRVTGRKKNLIVLNNGKKIAPEEIETKMASIPMVKEVMAYGASSGLSADDVKLAVMVYPDEKQTEGMSAYEILDALQQEVDKINQGYPTYKQIKLVNIREDAFEKTSSKKIRRQLV